MTTSSPMKRVLVIAGSDSSGGAGLEADQKVLAAHKCYAMTATTALTVQNTHGVLDVHPTPPAFVEKQINACIDDIGVDVVKCGMLASAETVEVVASSLRRHAVSTVVIDPVMVSTSGHQLLPERAIKTLREQLLPLATILTPNIPEAQLLLQDAGLPVPTLNSVDDLIATAQAVHSLGCQHVLLKGGHQPLTSSRTFADPSAPSSTNIILDILISPTAPPLLLESPHIATTSTHGTGCSLASAIAANLALAHPLPTAVQHSTHYLAAALTHAIPLGHGHGPIAHFHSLTIAPYPPGTFRRYLLAHPAIAPLWHAHLHHPFVRALAAGSLSPHRFQRFLVQDYHYLLHFARAQALAGAKARTPADIAAAADALADTHREMAAHLAYCAGEFGLAREAVEAAAEAPACVAYTRWVLDVGHAGDWVALQVAMLPCVLGYGYLARRLVEDAGSVREGNPYWGWVEGYAGEAFQGAVRRGEALLEREGEGLGAARVAELVEVFRRATALELGFWDMAME